MEAKTPPKHHYSLQNCDVPVPKVKFPSPRVKKGDDPRFKNRGAKFNAGRKPLAEKFTTLVPCVKNMVEQNGFAAHQRRRSEVGVSCGTTVPQIRDQVLNEVRGLENIGLTTVRYLFQPRQPNHMNASKYKCLVPAKVASKANNVRKENAASHFHAARVRYRVEFMSQFWKNSVTCSTDTMNKLTIGKLAVSRYHQIRKIFPTGDKPDYPDHDFPIGHGYKITPVGYMILQNKDPTVMARDDLGRIHYQFPRSGNLHMVNRVQKMSPLNIQCHANDIVNVTADEVRKGKTLLQLITDGGPDWNVKSWTVLLYLQRVFKRLDLDFLSVTCYAPGQSAFNPIEHAWSPLSRKLSGVTFRACEEGEATPPCLQKSISEEERKEKEERVFQRALSDLNRHWHGMQFDGFDVDSRGSQQETLETFADYDEIHPLLSRGSLRQLEQRPDLLEELKFTISHGDRQPGEFSLWKCTSASCSYCSAHPVKAADALKLIESLGGPPNPVYRDDVDDREHFATYIEATKLTRVSPLRNFPKSATACELCPRGYVFSSKIDEFRHRTIIHGLEKRRQSQPSERRKQSRRM